MGRSTRPGMQRLALRFIHPTRAGATARVREYDTFRRSDLKTTGKLPRKQKSGENMGLFDKLTAMFRGDPPVAAPSPCKEGPGSQALAADSVTFTLSGPIGPTVPVAYSEVATAMARYQFVLRNQLPPLNPDDQWWGEATHKRRLREGTEKSYSWLSPFIPVERAKSLAPETFKGVSGPLQATLLAKELRAVVRERRKLKQPHEDVLLALYGACVMADLEIGRAHV